MLKNNFLVLLLFLLQATAFAQRFPISVMNEGGSFDKEIAQGWMDVSPEKNKYDMHITHEETSGDTMVGFIKSKETTTGGAGAMLRTIAVDKYRGKRVRMTAWAKTSSVRDTVNGSGLWFLGIWEGAGVRDKTIISGTTEWKKYSMVVDMSPYVYQVTYGVFLYGTGEIRFKKIALEIVDKSVQVTAREEAH